MALYWLYGKYLHKLVSINSNIAFPIFININHTFCLRVSESHFNKRRCLQDNKTLIPENIITHKFALVHNNYLIIRLTYCYTSQQSCIINLAWETFTAQRKDCKIMTSFRTTPPFAKSYVHL